MTQAAPKRRWYQFGLRTMFVVVTVFAVFLAWLISEWQFVRARTAFIHRLREQNAFLMLKSETSATHRYSPDWEPLPIPIWRKWMGDDAVVLMVCPHETELSEAVRLFPEAGMLGSVKADTFYLRGKPVLH